MNKPYFAKYLPVEGEIKEGDKVRYSKGQLGFPDNIYTVLDNVKEMMSAKSVGGYGISWHKRTYQREDGRTIKEGAYLKIGYNINPKDITKVKPFLCSRDIQVGDEITYVGEDINHWVAPEHQELNYKFGDKNKCINDKIDKTGTIWIKVIGEISSEATWVKEGDEFDEDELRYIYTPEIKPSMCGVEPIPEREIVYIKGPCGHYH